MTTAHFCQQPDCTLNATPTYFPPSPPPSPPLVLKQLQSPPPVRSHIPSEEQLAEAVCRAKLSMGRNQDSLSKICGWIRENEPTWALTEKRVKKTFETKLAPPSIPAESAQPQAVPPTAARSYTQQAAARRPGHKCKTSRRRKSAASSVGPVAVQQAASNADTKLCSDHAACGPKCAVWRAKMLDKRLDGLDCELHEVTVRVRISLALVEKADLEADACVDLNLHVFHDVITGGAYFLAPEFVRSYLPTVSQTGGTLMHSLYTYNHAYGRGTPFEHSACTDCSARDWRAWAGCPQALAKKASSVSSDTDIERFRERIWLLDGQAEVLIGPECEPDSETIDPPILSSKGKNRA